MEQVDECIGFNRFCVCARCRQERLSWTWFDELCLRIYMKAVSIDEYIKDKARAI